MLKTFERLKINCWSNSQPPTIYSSKHLCLETLRNSRILFSYKTCSHIFSNLRLKDWYKTITHHFTIMKVKAASRWWIRSLYSGDATITSSSQRTVSYIHSILYIHVGTIPEVITSTTSPGCCTISSCQTTTKAIPTINTNYNSYDQFTRYPNKLTSKCLPKCVIDFYKATRRMEIA